MTGDGFVIGNNVRIWGTVKCEGTVQVQGFVDGGVIAPEVLISPQAMVTGDIVATRASVFGQVMGHIFADHVVLGEGSHVEGELYHTTMEMREGANFEGKSRRHDRPKSLAASLSYYDHSD